MLCSYRLYTSHDHGEHDFIMSPLSPSFKDWSTRNSTSISSRCNTFSISGYHYDSYTARQIPSRIYWVNRSQYMITGFECEPLLRPMIYKQIYGDTERSKHNNLFLTATSYRHMHSLVNIFTVCSADQNYQYWIPIMYCKLMRCLLYLTAVVHLVFAALQLHSLSHLEATGRYAWIPSHRLGNHHRSRGNTAGEFARH